jgi:hypothetical protein
MLLQLGTKQMSICVLAYTRNKFLAELSAYRMEVHAIMAIDLCNLRDISFGLPTKSTYLLQSSLGLLGTY